MSISYMFKLYKNYFIYVYKKIFIKILNELMYQLNIENLKNLKFIKNRLAFKIRTALKNYKGGKSLLS